MQVLFYFDKIGISYRAEKIKDNSDGSISLKYIHKGKSHSRKKVFNKDHAILIRSKTRATNFFKIVQRADA